MIKKYYCIHCSNNPVNHKIDKIDEVVQIFSNRLISLIPFNKRSIKIENWLFAKLNNFLRLLKILEVKENFDREEIFNRSLVLIDAAEKYNLKIRPIIRKFKNRYLNFFHFRLNNKDYYFEGLPVNLNNQIIDFDLIDNKYKLKKFLLKNNLPTAAGALFITKKGGYKYGLELDFPLVVKPQDASLSNHVTIKIQSEDELIQAIEIVKKYKNFYIVEKFIPGDVHRISVIGDKIFAVKRMPASVTGNGINTIRELIGIKNQTSQRMGIAQKNATLHTIEIDENTEIILAKQNLSLVSILEMGQKIFIKDKVNLTSGCDIIELTEKIHPANKLLFLRVKELLKIDILGIDFICQDIAKSWQEQECAIIECNSLPYIDMHHFPSEGSSQDVAKHIIELILKNTGEVA